jgi:hypothetical protein
MWLPVFSIDTAFGAGNAPNENGLGWNVGDVQFVTLIHHSIVKSAPATCVEVALGVGVGGGIVGVIVIVGVNDGVNDGVTVIVGVIDGVFVIVGVIDGVIVIVIVGVGDGGIIVPHLIKYSTLTSKSVVFVDTS